MVKNRDMPVSPVVDEKAFNEYLEGTRSSARLGMTKYEHVVLEFAKAMVSGWHGDNNPEDAPTVIMQGAQDLADEYFERIEAHRNK